MEYLIKRLKDLVDNKLVKVNVSGKEEKYIKPEDFILIVKTIHGYVIKAEKNLRNEIAAEQSRSMSLETDNRKKFTKIMDLEEQNKILKESLEKTIKV